MKAIAALDRAQKHDWYETIGKIVKTKESVTSFNDFEKLSHGNTIYHKLK